MSILYYDHLIVIESLDRKIKKYANSNEERQELWSYVEEVIHHRVLECCLDNLPSEHHMEFMDKFHQSPHDKQLIDYLNQKVGKDMEKMIKMEIKRLAKELKF